jgi:hypothetical protein
MLLAKRIDFYGQLILMVSFLLLTVLLSFDYVLGGYFIVGGWQFISVLIHYFGRNTLLRNHLRKTYEISLIVIIILGLLVTIVSYISVYYLLFLVWGTPLLAVWYGYITLAELKTWEARALIHLK